MSLAASLVSLPLAASLVSLLILALLRRVSLVIPIPMRMIPGIRLHDAACVTSWFG